MTLREMFPKWWCKVTFSVPENCYGNYNWLDFSIYEFFFSFVVVLTLKWSIHCLLFIVGHIIPDKTIDSSIAYPSLSGKDLDIANDVMEDLKEGDLKLNEDVFHLEESNKTTKKENFVDKDLDEEIETSIVNITRNGANK